MTLAFAGKSPRRRTFLVLAAFIAIIFSSFGAIAWQQSGAQATPPVGNVQVHKYLPKNNPPANAPWENQGVGQGTWTFSVYTTLADAQAGTNAIATFSQLGSNSPDLPQQELWIKETGMLAGHQFFGWFVPDGDNNSGNDKCNKEPLNGSTLNKDAILHIPAAYWTTKGNQTGLFHICAYNKPTTPPTTGTLDVIKVLPNLPQGVTVTGNFTGTVGSYNWTATTSTPWSQSGVTPGSFTVAEAAPTVTASDGGSVTNFGFHVLGAAESVCPTTTVDYGNAASNTTASLAADSALTFCVLNQYQAPEVVLRTLYVNKVIVSPAPDNSAIFSGTVDSAVALTWQTTNGVAVLVKNDLQPGVYHVHENAKTAYKPLGFAVVYSGAGTVCPAGPTATTEGLADLSGPNTVATVCVYNQPLVNVTVNKLEVTDGASSAGQGWKVTLSGCGFNDTKTTSGAGGSASWTDLAPCANYTLSEDTGSKPGLGFTPDPSPSVSFSLTGAGQPYTHTFINSKSTFEPFVPPLVIETLPTPVPPTATPIVIPPTATVVVPPITQEAVLGEKTPGPTPIAPVTGNGASTGNGPSAGLLIVSGLLLAAGALSTIAFARKEQNS
ncbi:MAG: hypothetical protein ABI782_01685 [Anaerolineaceae bacterium]